MQSSKRPAARLPHAFFFNETWHERAIAGTFPGDYEFALENPVVSSPALYAEAITLVAAVDSGTEDMEERFITFLLSVLRHSGAKTALSEADNARGQVSAVCSGLRTTDGAEALSITALAGKANMRRESFSRLFRRKTGLPPKAYVRCLRIEKGCRLLRQGKSIAETAFETGYTDQSHVHRMFVRICSATPVSMRSAKWPTMCIQK